MNPKTVLCIRHGESTFNAAWRATPVDPLHFDARLSEVGHAQVAAARPAVARYPVEVVLVSPLTRALQTAHGLFADHPQRPRLHVAPLLRERVENSCDVGRPPAALAAEFPAVDVAHLADPWWHHDGEADERGICVEPIAVVQARAAQFRQDVLARPERVVALVGHGTFFYHLTGRAMANCEVLELAW
ncbi:MAG: histidine phosphatase family protein [Burkholderiales bacterium]